MNQYPPFVPRHADIKNMLWEPTIKELAIAMVRARMKSALVENYTDLSHRHVADLFKRIMGTNAPSGPVKQASAKFFTKNTKTPTAMNIESAVFLGCYEMLEDGIPFPANEGWLLLVAYLGYYELTSRGSDPVLDINQAWALLRWYGTGSQRGRADIQRVTCPECALAYIIETASEVDTQSCPVCALHRQYSALAERKGARSGEK